jgi:hypothetical protein
MTVDVGFPGVRRREVRVANERRVDREAISSMDLVTRAQGGDTDALNDLCARAARRR